MVKNKWFQQLPFVRIDIVGGVVDVVGHKLHLAWYGEEINCWNVFHRRSCRWSGSLFCRWNDCWILFGHLFLLFPQKPFQIDSIHFLDGILCFCGLSRYSICSVVVVATNRWQSISFGIIHNFVHDDVSEHHRQRKINRSHDKFSRFPTRRQDGVLSPIRMDGILEIFVALVEPVENGHLASSNDGKKNNVNRVFETTDASKQREENQKRLSKSLTSRFYFKSRSVCRSTSDFWRNSTYQVRVSQRRFDRVTEANWSRLNF